MSSKHGNARIVLAANLRRLRKQQGLSQEKLAEVARLHRTYVSSVECGDRNISIDSIERLAKALGVSVVELLRERKSGRR